MKILYLKGGRVISEAKRLMPRLGDLPCGGPDKFLLAVLHYARSHDLRIASYGPQTSTENIGQCEAREYAARPITPSRIARKWAFLASVRKFMADTVRYKPDLILCGIDGPFAFITFVLARVLGARFVLLAHNALALPSASLPYRLAHGFLCKHADQIVAHGPFVSGEARKLGAPESILVEFNNGLDPADRSLIDKLPAYPVPENTTPRILFLGRIEEDKGALDLLTAFSLLPHECRAHLVFIGSGGAVEALEQYIRTLGLEGSAEVLREVPYCDVYRHLHSATVVVTPSQSRFPEGFCKSAIEAFYVGTPVVAPNYGPFPHIITHGLNGLLYEADNITSMREALERILSDTELRERLAEGAKVSGKALMQPKLNFADAIGRIIGSCPPQYRKCDRENEPLPE